MHGLWQKIELWDQWLFLLINRQGSNAFFDAWMPWIRESVMWAPLYLFLIVFAVHNFGWKGLAWVLGAVVSVSFSDTVSSQILKDAVGRLRPCQDPEFSEYVRFIVKRCPTSFSFTSSHAANHFAIAMFIWVTGRASIGKWLKLFFIWAFLISYAQVYVGVHYPLDILGGTAVGCLIGFITGKVFSARVSFGMKE